jgi:hypothetical protein
MRRCHRMLTGAVCLGLGSCLFAQAEFAEPQDRWITATGMAAGVADTASASQGLSACCSLANSTSQDGCTLAKRSSLLRRSCV